jgi:hypothetical protein
VEVVATVTVALPAVVPVMSTGELATVHVGTLVPVVGVTAQVNATAPVNPPPGVTVIVDVLPVVAPAITVIAPLLLRATDGVAETVPPFWTVTVANDGAYTELPESCTVSSLVPVAKAPFSESVSPKVSPVPPEGMLTAPISLPELKKVTVPVGGPPAVVPVTRNVTIGVAETEVEAVADAVVVVGMPDGAEIVRLVDPEVAA